METVARGRAMVEGGIHLDQNGLVRLDIRNDQSLFLPYGYIWQRGSFTVPADVSDERVQFAADKYRRKFGAILERGKYGFRVLEMIGPHEDKGAVKKATTDSDRRAYVIWAKVTRRPVTFHVEVPDEDVPMYQAAGFKLTS